eukprot:1157812-Pelagomonas_calceolata.AAC.6
MLKGCGHGTRVHFESEKHAPRRSMHTGRGVRAGSAKPGLHQGISDQVLLQRPMVEQASSAEVVGSRNQTAVAIQRSNAGNSHHGS